MTVFSARFVLRAALIGALAVGVAACGRKGPLDPPPSASAAPVEQPKPSSLNPITVSPMGSPNQGGADMLETPKGEKKRIFLDGLLN